jgi:hypothetical protein
MSRSEPKCVVCGCTQHNACDEGCEWVLSEPMLCSACVSTYFFVLWDFFFAMEGKAGARRRAQELRRAYDKICNGRHGTPTLRLTRAIMRREKAQVLAANREAVRMAGLNSAHVTDTAKFGKEVRLG